MYMWIDIGKRIAAHGNKGGINHIIEGNFVAHT